MRLLIVGRFLAPLTLLTAVLLHGCTQNSNSASPAAQASTSVSTAATGKVQVQHSRGTTEVPAQPQRVVVFDLSSLDTIDALDIKVLGVAGKLFPKHLQKYAGAEFPKVGTLFEPDYEALNAANPDLIIVGGRSAAKYDDLAKLAPTIDLSITDDDYMGSARKNAATLARLFGREDEAELRLGKLQSSVAALSGKAKGAGKALIILTTGGKMSAYGPGSRFGTIHTEFGFVPAVEGLKVGRHGEPVSFEFLAKTNPDWLFVVDRDAAIGESGTSAKLLLDNPLVNGTTAAQKGQIVYLDPANWYLAGGGLATLQAMTDEVSQALDSKTKAP